MIDCLETFPLLAVYLLSKWTFQNGKNIIACKKSASYLPNYLFQNPLLFFSSFGLFDELSIFSTFSKLNISIDVTFQVGKKSLHAKNQHPTFKFIHFRTVFHIPQRRDFDLKMRKLQTSIKSIILGLGIKQNLF